MIIRDRIIEYIFVRFILESYIGTQYFYVFWKIKLHFRFDWN